MTNVVSGQSNPVNATLNGVVAAVSVVLSPNRVTLGTAATIQVIANALDASGNTIVGPGVFVDAAGNPELLALTDTDASNSTTLSQGSLNKPTSGITLAYNGSASFSSATITVTSSALNGPSNTATLTASQTGKVAEFSIPTTSSYPFEIVTGSDGNLWFTEFGPNKIGRITPTGTITEFPTPPHPPAGSHPQGITAGADQNLWFPLAPEVVEGAGGANLAK